MLHGGKWAVTTEATAVDSEAAAASSAYNRGYNLYEDANRYGPAMPQIIAMMTAIEACQSL